MIVFDHVSYGYPADKSSPVVKDIALTIDDGEDLVIMGANGCGKTTLGLLLAGVLVPDSGRITIEFGGIPVEVGGPDPVIGFLFQDPDNGLVATTVEREVAFSLENRNMPADRMAPIVEQTLALFRMSSLKERLVWNLSGGEKQRLSLAGLFACRSRILFLDEPASFLDYPGALQMDEALRQIKGADPTLTIIRVTQYPRVAERYPRILVMAGGEIVGDSTPESVFADHELLIGANLRPPLRFLSPRPDAVKKPLARAFPAEDMQPLVVLDSIHFAFENGGEPALFRNLSLTINAREVLGLVGPSGCGKSTLAQLLCGIYEPTGGSIEFSGKAIRAAMSFQQPERQFFLDSVYDEVAYGIRNNVESNTLLEDMVRRSLAMAGLEYETFKDRDPHTLSGGEARRLAFTIVIALDTDMVVFDEPTCGLDETGVGAFQRLVRALKREGKTVVIISHNSDIIAELADRVALLSEGRILAVQPPGDFFAGGGYQELLSMPEVIDYQIREYGKVITPRAGDIFDLERFCA